MLVSGAVMADDLASKENDFCPAVLSGVVLRLNISGRCHVYARAPPPVLQICWPMTASGAAAECAKLTARQNVMNAPQSGGAGRSVTDHWSDFMRIVMALALMRWWLSARSARSGAISGFWPMKKPRDEYGFRLLDQHGGCGCRATARLFVLEILLVRGLMRFISVPGIDAGDHRADEEAAALKG